MKKFILLLAISAINTALAQNTITYPSKDGVTITADLYKIKKEAPFILLFHQAGWSRGEYQEIAPKLNQMGYHVLAVDQRSGGKINEIVNQTHIAAKKAGKNTQYADAFQDIEASIAYIKKQYRPKKIIIWGSSYSSALVLKYAGDYPNTVQAVLSFSPGEYFNSKNYISHSAKNITIPVFITSSKQEKSSWSDIYDVIPSSKKQFYLPTSNGNHGSRALWEKFDDHHGYWQAVIYFLNQI